MQTASNLWIGLKLQKERFINLWLTSLFEGIEFLISDSITLDESTTVIVAPVLALSKSVNSK